MKTFCSIFILFALISIFVIKSDAQYTPDWDSLDKRPLPSWYDEAKIGIFIHWGVYSVPSFYNEWFWEQWKGWQYKPIVDFMNQNYPPGFTYADFARDFTAEFFDPNQWADIFQASGANYVVLTSKHHEGYTLWPSNSSWNWNSVDVGPKRDLVGDLANAIRNNTKLRFGLYHSLFEWFHPLYLNDKANNFSTQDFVRLKTMPELYDIVNNYKPEVIWSDGDWEAPYAYWNSTEFLAWLYNESPVKDTVVTNDRWGKGVICQHSGYYTCTDRYNPGHLLNHKWENAMTIDKVSWAFRRNMKLSELLTIEQVIFQVVTTVSCGGNILIDVGPTKEGTIAAILEERLRQLGSWLSVNGEAIYATQPWTYQNDTVNGDVWYTSKGSAVYATLLKYPQDSTQVILGAPKTSGSTNVELLGFTGQLKWMAQSTGGILIELASIPINKVPTEWALVFKLTNIS